MDETYQAACQAIARHLQTTSRVQALDLQSKSQRAWSGSFLGNWLQVWPASAGWAAPLHYSLLLLCALCCAAMPLEDLTVSPQTGCPL